MASATSQSKRELLCRYPQERYTPTQYSIAALERQKPSPTLGLACGLAHLSLGHKTAKFLTQRRLV